MAATRNVLLGVAVLTAAFVATPVDAQMARDARERSNSRDEAPALIFPDATREVEDGKVSPRLSRQLNDMIKALNEQDKPERAREIADAVLANERANAYEKSVAAQVAASAAGDMDDTAASIAYMERALAENGLDNEQHYSTMQNLGITYITEGQAPKAIEILTRLLDETKSQNPDFIFALAGAHYEAEQYPQAIEVLKRLLATGAEPKPQRCLSSSWPRPRTTSAWSSPSRRSISTLNSRTRPSPPSSPPAAVD